MRVANAAVVVALTTLTGCVGWGSFPHASGTNVDLSAQSKFSAAGNGGSELSSSATTDVKGSVVNIN